jgi:hypothetical protein
LLRGREDPWVFHLTGAPAEDLRGRAFEFTAPENDRPPTEEDRRMAESLHSQQIGATGEMSAARKVRIFDCSTEEFLRRSELGEPPPTRWVNGLYFEWFSQNGRVVIELTEPKIEFIEYTKPKIDHAALQAEMEKWIAEQKLAKSSEIETAPIEDEIEAPESAPEEDAAAPGEDGYGLIPDELTRDLERSARRVDREMSGESEEAIRALEECELIDDVLEHGEGVPIREAFVEMTLADPASLATEEEAGNALRAALAELALYGVAFHICEHFTLREAYRTFVNRVCKNNPIYPQMRGSGWVQHFTTSDYCKECSGEEIDPDA